MDWFQKLLDIDRDWFLFLNQFHTGYWDTVMLLVTRKEFWLPLYGAILYFIFRTQGRKGFLIVFFMLLAVFTSDQVSVLIKDSVQRLRPVHAADIQNLVHNVLRKGGLYGFPSSHAANAFTLLAFTAPFFRNRIYFTTVLVWALLISYSRIYAGVHYPFDVLAGIILGIGFGILFCKLVRFIESRISKSRSSKKVKTKASGHQIALIALIFAVHLISLMVTAWILHKYNYL